MTASDTRQEILNELRDIILSDQDNEHKRAHATAFAIQHRSIGMSRDEAKQLIADAACCTEDVSARTRIAMDVVSIFLCAEESIIALGAVFGDPKLRPHLSPDVIEWVRSDMEQMRKGLAPPQSAE